MWIIGYIFKSTTRTIELYFYFLTLLYSPLPFLFLKLLSSRWWKLWSTHWTVNVIILLHSVSNPYLKTLEMEVISTLNLTETKQHLWSHWFLTNRTNRILLQFHPLTKNRRFTDRSLSLLYDLTRQLDWNLVDRILWESRSESSSFWHRMFPWNEIF